MEQNREKKRSAMNAANLKSEMTTRDLIALVEESLLKANSTPTNLKQNSLLSIVVGGVIDHLAIITP
jgi:hypothetical protein